MAQLLNNLLDLYNQLMLKSDQRVNDWPLMSSPLPTIGICLTYILIVKKIGPYFMKDRQPYDIRIPMIIYNFLMVIISAMIVYYFTAYAWFKNYSFTCQPVDYSNSSDAILIAKTSYFYYLVKFLEFTDTFFFVLRKKTNQITNLHVIHHSLLPFSVWWGMKFVPGGHATFFGYINSFIHVIMYTYYGLSAIGPHVQKRLWWKKYLTVIQMVQFVIIFTHAFQLLFVNDCKFPKIFALWIGAHGILFIILFSNFYDKAYNGKRDRKPQSALANGVSKLDPLLTMCNGTQHKLINDSHKNGLHKIDPIDSKSAKKMH